MPVLLTIIPDCLYGTTRERFFAGRFFLIRLRLLVDKRITVHVRSFEVFRCRISAHITVDTGRVDVVSSGNILFYAVVSIRQALIHSSNQQHKLIELQRTSVPFRASAWVSSFTDPLPQVALTRLCHPLN